MIKRIALMMALIASLLIVSCSDDDNSEPSKTDSQAFQSELTGLTDGLASSKGAAAMSESMPIMDFLPFSMPVKSLNQTFEKLEKTGKIAQASLVKQLFPASSELSKQDDHFIFANHLGTYTLASATFYTNPQTGETYITAATWDIVYGGAKIIVIIPKSVSQGDYDIRIELSGYTDELINWTDAELYQNSEYFPTLIDLDVFADNINVFDLYFTGDWDYIAAMDEVMPKTLTVDLILPPYSFDLTMSMVSATQLAFDMILKENNTQILAVSLDVVFKDATWDDFASIDIVYESGGYKVELFANSTFTDYIDSEAYTMQGEVDYINAAEHVYLKISEGTTLIGQLKAKVVWDEEAWNEDTQTYGANVIVYYIHFTDGSEMTMEQFAALFAGYMQYISK